MRFVPTLPYLSDLPKQTIPCSAIGLPDTFINIRYRFVWHWDVLGAGTFGPGYSISEYTTGYNLAWGYYRLEDAIKAALDKIQSGDVSLEAITTHLPHINDPENYFIN